MHSTKETTMNLQPKYTPPHPPFTTPRKDHSPTPPPVKATASLKTTSIRIANLSINDMTSFTNTMIDDFLRAWEVDILLVQEVTKHELHDLRGNTTLYNIGTSGWGTAIIARERIILENLNRLP